MKNRERRRRWQSKRPATIYARPRTEQQLQHLTCRHPFDDNDKSDTHAGEGGAAAVPRQLDSPATAPGIVVDL